MDDNTYMDATKTVTFTAGAPGAGKGFVIDRDYAELHVVDCDKHKQAHPDYDPKNPGALHVWSSEQATKEFFSMLAGDDSFVFDGTGTDTAKLANFMNQATLAGFRTQVCYVKVSLATALDRNSKRDRVVPESLVREKFATIATAVEILAGYADELRVVRND